MRLPALIVALGLAGCDRIKFVDNAVNAATFPAELQLREVFEVPGTYARDLTALAGHVLYAKRTNRGCGGPYRDASVGPRYLLPSDAHLETDSRADVRFEALIDRGATIEVGYTRLAGTLTAQQVAEISIVDSASVVVPDTSIPVDDLEELATKPLPDGYCDRFYVRGVILMTITTRVYEQLSADASVTGVAFGAKKNIYGNQSARGVDYRIGLTLKPIRPDFDASLALPAASRAFLPLDAVTGLKPL